jgi:GNAT superfamily N-acetyltransferase
MPSHLCRINKLEKIEDEDQTIQALLARFGIETTNQVKQRHVLIARNQQQTKSLGLLIAEYSQSTTIKITYIHVKTMWRRLSIGHALLKRLEQDCRAKGITTITATFDQRNQAMNALTKSHKGWNDGERLNAYTFESRSAMEPILQKLESTMDHRTKQTEIRRLCECNKQDIIHASEINHVPQWAQLNATNLSTTFDDLSRVFIQNNQIIGWLITFPLPDETLDYRILWIKEDHRKTGVAIRALTAVIRQAHFQDNVETAKQANDLGNPWPKGFFIMHSQNQAMVNFVNKRLAPGTNQQSSLIYREKLIK